MKKYQKTSDAKKGGLFVGKSHAKGGIPAIVVDTGQEIEVEGGEVIINKEASKKYWKELSHINQSAGGGVPIPPPMEFSEDVEKYKGGGKITLSAIRQGTEIEMEHAKTIEEYKKSGISVKEVAQKIAKDHLKENPNYYKVLTKVKLAKGGEVVCRSCSNTWKKHQKDVGMNVFQCDSCGGENSKFYAKGTKIPSKNSGGDCYYVAGTIAMSEKLPKTAQEFKKPNFVGTPYVVHAEVSGQGAIAGLRYGHAWVEDDLNVYDFSNGREIVFPKQLYYSIGNVIEKKPKYYKYTFKEAIDKMLETGHYGSWELKTDSGL